MKPEIVIIGVVLIALSIYQFVGNATLYIDEAMLINEVMERPMSDLGATLGHSQVAPIPFLIGMKGLSLLLGAEEWVFRLIPYLSFLVFLCILPITLSFFGGRIFVAVAYLLIGSNWFIMYYASTTKQYAVDVMVAQVLLLLMLSKKYRTHPVLFALFVSASICISHVGIMLAVAVLLFLGVHALQKRVSWRKLSYTLAATGVSFGFVYFTQIQGHPTGPSMYEFWQDYFMPLPFFGSGFLKFIYSEFSYVWGAYMLTPLAGIEPIRAITFVSGALLTLLGSRDLVKRGRADLLALLTLPVLVHLMVSGLGKYPFTSRFILYLIPLCTILFLVGARVLYGHLVAASRVVRITTVTIGTVLFLGYAALMAVVFPVKNSEVKSALLYILSQKGSDDKVMYDTPAEPIVSYYEAYNQLGASLAAVDFVALQVNDEPWEPHPSDDYGEEFWVIRTHTVDLVQVAEAAYPYEVSSKTFAHCTVLHYAVPSSHTAALK